MSKKPCTKLLQSSQNQSSKKQHSKKQSTMNKYITQFPKNIRPYIDDIVDVKADGNYGI